MADEKQLAESGGAPTAAVPRAPVSDNAQAPKPKRRRNRARGGNGATTGNRGGRRKLTDDEKRERAEARINAEADEAKAEQARAETRRQMARIASIGALTPHLLDPQEVSALSRFALAMVQGVAPAAPEQAGQ